MAPQTNIGSSTPVSVDGGEIPSDLRRKVINDAAASLRELAEEHGRNGDWAERAVRVGANTGAREALRADVIDVIAPTLPALLNEIDGRKTVPKGFVLNTAGAQIDDGRDVALEADSRPLIDPNIIALMLSIGLLGIVVELWNPGLIFPGTVGGISLIVGLYGLQVLPVSGAGLLLMLLAAGFWVAELFIAEPRRARARRRGLVRLRRAHALRPGRPRVPGLAGGRARDRGHGGRVHGAGGDEDRPGAQAPVEVGAHTLVGTAGVVRGDGFVFANGELWRARLPGRRSAGRPRRRRRPSTSALVVDVRRADEPQPVA